jgi:uncharacterized membrane-anchored protein
MRLIARRPPVVEPTTITGPVKTDRRTRRLAGRLRPGDIALIDHTDLDRVSAEALVAANVAAVLNAKRSISGRYPNLGPELLVARGVPLVDGLGEDAFEHLREGTTARVDGDAVVVDGVVVARGVRQDAERVATAMASARQGITVSLETFAANTVEYLRQERDLLLDGVGLPAIRTRIEGRHCLVVVRGYDYRTDLHALRPYLRQFRPVLIGVDGGADALLEAGARPDLIVGDMAAISDAAMRCGAELVVHVHPDGRGSGLARANQLNLPAVTFTAAASSEDLALLLADAKGAAVIVGVGTHATLAEFLDQGRDGMASTFLTRLRLGGKLVDAKAVGRLQQPGPSTSSVALLVATSLTAMAAAVLASTVGRPWLDGLARRWDELMVGLQGLFQ